MKKSTRRLVSLALPLIATSVYAQEPILEIGAQQSWGENLLKNGTFENELAGWSPRIGATQQGPPASSMVSIDEAVFFSGARSLRLSGNAATTRWYAMESDPIPIKAGISYRVSGRVRADGVRQEEGQYFNANIYVQFLDDRGQVVPIGGSPVRATERITGSTDWREVQRVVRPPEGSTFAKIGCVLTCTGTLWFDDVTLQPGEEVAWQRVEAERFIYYHTGTDGPTAAQMAEDLKYLTDLEKLLDLRHTSKIPYYRYASGIQMTLLTGTGGKSHAEGDEIHTTVWNDKHDLVHVLMSGVGRSVPFVVEGIAYYAPLKVHGEDVHGPSRELLRNDRLAPVRTLMAQGGFERMLPQIAERQSASFIGFLVERHGAARFKQFYAFRAAPKSVDELDARAREVYGMSLEELDAQWRDFLTHDAAAPK